jgi:hypothetical protein
VKKGTRHRRFRALDSRGAAGNIRSAATNSMSQQFNKGIKKKRRLAYLKRKKARRKQAKASKAKA